MTNEILSIILFCNECFLPVFYIHYPCPAIRHGLGRHRGSQLPCWTVLEPLQAVPLLTLEPPRVWMSNTCRWWLGVLPIVGARVPDRGRDLPVIQ